MLYSITMFTELIIFALYIFICLTLLRPRFTLKVCITAYAIVSIFSVFITVAVVAAGHETAALTLLLLTAYLPFSICLYILSEGSIFEKASAFSIGVLGTLIIKTIKKMLPWIFTRIGINGFISHAAVLVIVLVLAAAEAFIIFRFIQKSFRECIRAGEQNKILIVIPTAAVFLLIFNNFNSTSSATVLILTLVIATAFFVISFLLFTYSARLVESVRNEKILSERLEQQRRNFEQLSSTIDAGRHYRHDIRHHLAVLKRMAQQNSSSEILNYIGNLSESAELCEPKLFCKNPAINAIISEYIIRTESLGGTINYNIFVPEEIPFELPDICIILSNALENALNACAKCSDDKKCIDLLIDFSDEQNLRISVKNYCAQLVEIDADGLPVIKNHEDGHGIGLLSVKKTVEKYNGFLCCSCENLEFVFLAVIFHALDNTKDAVVMNDEKLPLPSKIKTFLCGAITMLICIIVAANVSPSVADALSEVFSVKLKTLSYGWGENRFHAEYPEFSGENSDVLNKTSEDFINEASDIFWKYAIQKYEGYVSSDAGFQVHLDNEKYMSMRFYATLNVGGSVDYSRCITIDKQTGKELSLSDLFDKDYDYIKNISAEILSQMEYRVLNGQGNYFIPGGIWSEEECFKEISPEQNFYLNADGKLIIAFDEYEVAPGSAGAPEFVMPDDIFILK